MSDQIAFFLIDTILGLFSMVLLLRFYLQLFRVPAHNQLSKFLFAATDFIVRPARRVIPGWKGMDLSTLVLAWVVECIIVTSFYMLQGFNVADSIGVIALLGVFELLKMTLYIMLIMIIVQAVLSWINPQSPLAPMLSSFTQPILGVFRRRIPTIANVDLSPLFALIVIQLLLMVVTGMQMEARAMF